MSLRGPKSVPFGCRPPQWWLTTIDAQLLKPRLRWALLRSSLWRWFHDRISVSETAQSTKIRLCQAADALGHIVHVVQAQGFAHRQGRQGRQVLDELRCATGSCRSCRRSSRRSWRRLARLLLLRANRGRPNINCLEAQ